MYYDFDEESITLKFFNFNEKGFEVLSPKLDSEITNDHLTLKYLRNSIKIDLNKAFEISYDNTKQTFTISTHGDKKTIKVNWRKDKLNIK